MKGQETAFARLAGLMVAGLALGLWAGEAGAQTAKKLNCKGCVKSKQIKNRAIKGADIKNSTIDTNKVKDESLTGQDIKDGSVGAADLAPAAVVRPTYVFRSSEVHDGAFGTAAWDALCQADAVAAPLPPGEYRAWISDNAVDARDMLPSGPFVNTRGLFVALNRADLLDARLINPIDRTATGGGMLSDGSWTGTGTDGTSVTPNCANWTANDPVTQGVFGDSTESLAGWTDSGPLQCDALLAVYCVQIE